MPHLEDLLHDAVGDIGGNHDADLAALEERVAERHQARRRRVVALGALVSATALVVGSAVLRRPDHAAVSTKPEPPPTATRGVFEASTGTVLVFDDGIDGVTLVDLDRRLAVRRAGQGQRAGDQPYRMHRVGSELILGWGEIYAAPLRGGAPTKLGDATIFVPAAEDDRVWLVDFPVTPTGYGAPTFRQMNLDGNVLVEAPAPDVPGLEVGIGISGGLALTSDTGVDLWDAASEQITGHLGTGRGFVGAIHGDQLAWCENPCTSINVTRLSADLATVTSDNPGPWPLVPGSARFSPDGTTLAVAVQHGEGAEDVVLVDTATGAATTAVSQRPGYLELAWSPDGSQVFFIANSYQQGSTDIGRYDVATGDLETTKLPFGGLLDAVGATPAEVGTWPAPGEPADCPAPPIQPSGRTADCAFAW